MGTSNSSQPRGVGSGLLPGWLCRRLSSVVALLVAVAGIVDVFSVLTPEVRPRLRVVVDALGGETVRSAAALTLVSGCLLVLVAHGLRKRKRRAWRIAAVALSASVAFNLWKGLDYEEAILAAFVLIVLLVTRAEFSAQSDPRSRLLAPVAVVGMGAVSVVLGVLALELRDGQIVGPHPLHTEFAQVLLGMVGLHGPLRFRHDGVEDLIFRLNVGMGLLTLVVVAYLVLRPAEPEPHLSADDEYRVRELLTRFGHEDSLAYFSLRRDKSLIWSPSGKAAVAYRVVSGVMLASGDPLGDLEAWPGAVDRFLEHARRNAWTPAVIGCSERAGKAWTRAGLDAIELGDEAVVTTDEFTLDGRPMRNVRQAVARVERAGYTFDVRRVEDIPAGELAAACRTMSTWRGSETERGFSMALGRIGDPTDGRAVLATAHRDGELAALLHFVPWGTDGLSLDVMIRDRSADNGMNEFLISRMLQHAPELGVVRVSLNFAVFRAALARGERLGAGFVLRLWRNALLFLSRWFQIESLYKFNAKFQPTWTPRYLCYPRARDLPRIGLAVLEAERFIAWPQAGQRMPGRLRSRMRPAPHL